MILQHLNIAVLLSSPEGNIVLTQTVPETVTSWSAKALCISEKKGFGISEVTSLTTFKPISLSVHQVHAAVMGERLPVMVTVNNNLKKCIPVKTSVYHWVQRPVCLTFHIDTCLMLLALLRVSDLKEQPPLPFASPYQKRVNSVCSNHKDLSFTIELQAQFASPN
ncbi:alpha-2-macroglobulin-like protein [Plakobranchus ocellatus]|uniref:Alpha-2-macroglobulin-like protein n=1 Tax=Plakobranchus ocellatus TaxID=259542 RepID=A0AAV4CMI6_9GAST|nr:alpha-2-macroglobulin-like protein [Plakobranchus ocellatus]